MAFLQGWEPPTSLIGERGDTYFQRSDGAVWLRASRWERLMGPAGPVLMGAINLSQIGEAGSAIYLTDGMPAPAVGKFKDIALDPVTGALYQNQ